MPRTAKTPYYRTEKIEEPEKSIRAKRREYLVEMMCGPFSDPPEELKIAHDADEIMRRAETAYEALRSAVSDAVDDICLGAAIGDHVDLNRLFIVFYPTVTKEGFGVKKTKILHSEEQAKLWLSHAKKVDGLQPVGVAWGIPASTICRAIVMKPGITDEEVIRSEPWRDLFCGSGKVHRGDVVEGEPYTDGFLLRWRRNS